VDDLEHQIAKLISDNPETAPKRILEIPELAKALKVARLLGGTMKGGR
jgi:hypothetical protein